jgi:hypothetical protein
MSIWFERKSARAWFDDEFVTSIAKEYFPVQKWVAH